jgi:4'-phosphopantetheinyl transferase
MDRSQPSGRDEVVVWQVGLETDSAPFRALLSDEELAAADRFRFEQDRAHYAVARGALRIVLGRHLDTAPAAIRFEYGAHGKPSVAGGSELRFNLSHSHGRALIAVARGREVGVDLEYVHREVADEEVARRFFSPEEVQALENLPESARTPAFFRCWTRKEAYLKARGDGIHYGLHHFTVSLGPGEEPALLANTLHPDETARWTMRDVHLGPDFQACVVAEGFRWTLHKVDFCLAEKSAGW